MTVTWVSLYKKKENRSLVKLSSWHGNCDEFSNNNLYGLKFSIYCLFLAIVLILRKCWFVFLLFGIVGTYFILVLKTGRNIEHFQCNFRKKSI